MLFSCQGDGTEQLKVPPGYESLSDYLEEMGKDGTWGDNIMLQAAADCYERPIKVITSLPHNEETLIMPVTVSAKDPLVLGRAPKYQYVSLLPGDSS